MTTKFFFKLIAEDKIKPIKDKVDKKDAIKPKTEVKPFFTENLIKPNDIERDIDLIKSMAGFGL